MVSLKAKMGRASSGVWSYSTVDRSRADVAKLTKGGSKGGEMEEKKKKEECVAKFKLRPQSSAFKGKDDKLQVHLYLSL